MATITLKRTGQQMPLVGLGLWKVDNPTCADTVYQAIKQGCRLFDGAGDYGNEKEAGEGVRRAIKDGLVKREDLFITSKLWNTFHAKEHVKPIAKKQLQDWGIDYFDLYLIHFPIALKYVDPAHRYPPGWQGDDDKVHLQNTSIQETWTCLEGLLDDGLVKNIGLSNANGALISDVLRYARIQPQVLQVELHPYLSQAPLVDFTKLLGITITAYSSFGPQSYYELGSAKDIPSLFDNSKITAIAQKHNKTPAQVLLRWSTQRGIAVIPKSNKTERMTENLLSTSFNLDESDIKEISSLNANIRANNPVDIDPRLAIFA